MKQFFIMSALILTIGLAQAKPVKEFTYEWLVNQFKESQVDNVEHIKKHLVFYTQLVVTDLADAKREANKINNNDLKLFAGTILGYFGIEGAVRSLIYWPRVEVHTKTCFVAGDRVFDLHYLTTLVLRIAASSIGIFTIKEHITTSRELKKRIALDKSILADLYALS